MNPVRAKMDAALKAVVVPKLRAMKCTGTFPHFRRVVGERAELLTFQFNRDGGSFVVELAVCSGDDIKKHWNERLTLKNVTAHDVSLRFRLGASSKGSDHWFVYGKKAFEPGHDKVESNVKYESVADDVANLLDSRANLIWRGLTTNSSGSPTAPAE